MSGTGGTLRAHGIGGARDLPIPLDLAIVGAVAALVVSFVVLAAAWRVPRYEGPDHGRLAPAWLDALVASTAWRVALRAFGLAMFAFAAAAAFWGEDLLTNPFFGIVYVFVWVGLVPASLLAGPVWRAISPVRTLHLLLCRLVALDPDQGMVRYPERLGLWPAALGLLAFAWLELVHPGSASLAPLRLWCLAYLSVMLVGGAVFGSVFFARADPFEVYSTLVARLSVWGRREGRLVVRRPLANLATTPPSPGLAAVVCVLLATTAYDSFSVSRLWSVQSRFLSGSVIVIETAVLGTFCVLVGLLFALGSTATATRPGVSRWRLPDLFGHSLVPIVVGYVAAHYTTLLINTGQRTLIHMSDPFGTGVDLLGTGDLTVSYWLSQRPTLLAALKVLGVVLGHLLGVVAAHDRALVVISDRHRVSGQLPLLLVMIVFTASGVFLLFAS